MNIREARPEDASQLSDIFYITWVATYPNAEHGITLEDIEAHFGERKSPASIERSQKSIADTRSKGGWYFVAEIDGRAVGLCRVFVRPEHNQLQAMYVLPEFQGRGVAKALWEAARENLDPLKPTIVHVVNYNARAIAFYKKLGFRETGKTFTEERFRMKSGAIFTETELIKDPVGPRV